MAARFSHAAELLAAQATMATASASATAAAAASVFYKKEETKEEKNGEVGCCGFVVSRGG